LKLLTYIIILYTFNDILKYNIFGKLNLFSV
jgi:hypothetical protein